MTASKGLESDPITIREIKEIAKKNLSKEAWDYYSTGVSFEQTLSRNETIFNKSVMALEMILIEQNEN